METLTIEPDADTREAFIEAMVKLIGDTYASTIGIAEDQAMGMARHMVPGGIRAYFARPSARDPHHVAYQMFCKGMMHQRLRKPLNA